MEGDYPEGHESFISAEYLAGVNDNGAPDHELLLKPNAIVTVLRNLSVSGNILNGTKLIVVAASRNLLRLRFPRSSNVINLPRINFTIEIPRSGIEFTRRQFPVRLSYATTVNRTQGKTLDKVLLDLRHPVFTHGQLYVALGRVQRCSDLAILANSTDKVLHNVVFQDLLFDTSIAVSSTFRVSSSRSAAALSSVSRPHTADQVDDGDHAQPADQLDDGDHAQLANELDGGGFDSHMMHEDLADVDLDEKGDFEITEDLADVDEKGDIEMTDVEVDHKRAPIEFLDLHQQDWPPPDARSPNCSWVLVPLLFSIADIAVPGIERFRQRWHNWDAIVSSFRDAFLSRPAYGRLDFDLIASFAQAGYIPAQVQEFAGSAGYGTGKTAPSSFSSCSSYRSTSTCRICVSM